jgi:ParB-like nuclease domain/DNA methylase
MAKPLHHESSRSIGQDGAGGLALVYRPIAELKRARSNPRIHSKKQIRQIASSIKAFGFLVPVIIDRLGAVIAGHGRVMAAEFLGLTQVPTICVEHLNEAQIKAFMIADNRLTENSTWDDRLIAEQLKELSLLDLDFDIEVTGFNTGEIDLRIEGFTSESEGTEDAADALSVPEAGPPVTRLGDLWLLDRHRVCCGSALEDAALAALMQGKKAAMVFTDPPYNVAIDGHVSGLGAIRHREFPMASGEMNEAEFLAFLRQVLSLLILYSARGSLLFVCMDWRHLFELLAAARQVYIELKNLCVWIKANGGWAPSTAASTN